MRVGVQPRSQPNVVRGRFRDGRLGDTEDHPGRSLPRRLPGRDRARSGSHLTAGPPRRRIAPEASVPVCFGIGDVRRRSVNPVADTVWEVVLAVDFVLRFLAGQTSLPQHGLMRPRTCSDPRVPIRPGPPRSTAPRCASSVPRRHRRGRRTAPRRQAACPGRAARRSRAPGSSSMPVTVHELRSQGCFLGTSLPPQCESPANPCAYPTVGLFGI